MKAEVAADRAAAVTTEIELNEEQTKSAALEEQISALAAEIEAEKAKTAKVRGELARARERGAELVLEKRHKEEELAAAKKATATDAAVLTEAEE
jgi:uncharacterized membrane-anchored protein